MKTVVVIPTYNEADCIETTLSAVVAEAPDVDVLVVDDNSPDGTAARVAAHREFGRRVFLLNRAEKDGIGAAYRAGFAQALLDGYDVVVQMDADLSHPPERIMALLAGLARADVAIGSRYVDGGGVSDWSWWRRLVSWGGNTYVRAVLGLAVRDTTAGFKAFRRDALLRIGAVDSESSGYSFQIENTWQAARLGLRIVEVPITFTDRRAGSSKMSAAIMREALVRVLAWRWSDIRHPVLAPTHTPTEFSFDHHHAAG